MPQAILAWHFSDGSLHYDYEGTKIEAGLTLETTQPPNFEKSGFHAALRPLDAFHWYAIRPQSKFIVSRVRLSGEILDKDIHAQHHPRLVAQKREHLWLADAESTLQAFLNDYRHRYENISEDEKQFYRETISRITPDLTPESVDKLLQIKDYTRIFSRSLQFQILDFFKEYNKFLRRVCYLRASYEPPKEYFDEPCEDMLAEPNQHLHTMLMQLAPSDYSE